jgi:hypothetical protein
MVGLLPVAAPAPLPVKISRFLASSLLALGFLSLTHPASAQPLVTGVSGLDDYSVTSFEQAKAAGASFVRIPVSWRGVAPQDPPPGWRPEDPTDPNYDWEEIDAAVVTAVASGMTPLLQVDGAPAWAERCQPPGYAIGAACDPDPGALAVFAEAAAKRYSGGLLGLPKVRYWQGLNEPNLSRFFFPQYAGDAPRSPELYRILANAFHDAVSRVDRSNVVLLGGLGPVAVPGFTIGPMRFVRDLLCMRGRYRFRPLPGNCGGGVRFDVFDVHPYTTGGPTHRGNVDDVQLGDLAKLQRLLAAAEKAGRIDGRYRQVPLWITEFAWDSNPPDPGGLAMRTLSRWTAEALFQAWRAGVSHFFWFPLRDQPLGRSPSETLQGGLYFRGATPSQDQPKEVRQAFRFPLVAYPRPRGLAYWGRTPTGAPGRLSIQVLHRGRWRNVKTVRAGRSGIFEGAVKIGYGRDGRGRVRALFRKEASLPFTMRGVGDFPQPPFG